MLPHPHHIHHHGYYHHPHGGHGMHPYYDDEDDDDIALSGDGGDLRSLYSGSATSMIEHPIYNHYRRHGGYPHHYGAGHIPLSQLPLGYSHDRPRRRSLGSIPATEESY